MRIHIETAGGGGLVLLAGLAIVADRGGGGISTAAIVIGAVVGVVVLAAIIAVPILIWRHLRREIPSPRGLVRMSPPSVIPGQLGPPPRALDAPVRLADDQLEQLAEILRRTERPEH